MKSAVGVLVVLLGTLLPASAFAQAQDQSRLGPSGIRLALFSPQRAFAESAAGKAGLDRITALREERSREVEERNKTLQEQEQALQQSLSVLSEDARTQRTKDIEKFRLDTQRFVEDAQAELLGVQRDIENAFAITLQPALEQVVKDERIQLVLNLDAGTVAWFDPSLDITDDVVKQLASR